MNCEGIDPAPFIDASALSQIAAPDVEPEFCEALDLKLIERALIRMPQEAGLGFKAGQILGMTTSSIVGLAISTAPTILAALNVFARFSRHSFFQSRIKKRETGGKIYVDLDVSGLSAPVQRFLFEAFLAAIEKLISGLTDDFEFSNVEAHAPFFDPQYEKDLETLTPIKVVSGQSSFSFVADIARLRRPISGASDLIHAHCVRECETTLVRREENPDYAQRIREFIVRSEDYSPNARVVAEALGMSERTLRRRLHEEGLNFGAIVMETRMASAKALLNSKPLSVKVVAARLGYAESASFIRAFTKWWGVSPGAVKVAR